MNRLQSLQHMRLKAHFRAPNLTSVDRRLLFTHEDFVTTLENSTVISLRFDLSAGWQHSNSSPNLGYCDVSSSLNHHLLPVLIKSEPTSILGRNKLHARLEAFCNAHGTALEHTYFLLRTDRTKTERCYRRNGFSGNCMQMHKARQCRPTRSQRSRGGRFRDCAQDAR